MISCANCTKMIAPNPKVQITHLHIQPPPHSINTEVKKRPNSPCKIPWRKLTICQNLCQFVTELKYLPHQVAGWDMHKRSIKLKHKIMLHINASLVHHSPSLFFTRVSISLLKQKEETLLISVKVNDGESEWCTSYALEAGGEAYLSLHNQAYNIEVGAIYMCPPAQHILSPFYPIINYQSSWIKRRDSAISVKSEWSWNCGSDTPFKPWKKTVHFPHYNHNF